MSQIQNSFIQEQEKQDITLMSLSLQKAESTGYFCLLKVVAQHM